MHLKLSVLLAAVGALATPALAQDTAPTLIIAPGEMVTARITEDPPGFEVIGREPATLRLDAHPAAAAPNTVRFTFGVIEGQGPVLKVQSGYDRHFDYRARMFRGDRSAQTSVCTVMPRITGFEMWPHPIDRLELTDPHFVQVVEGRIACR